MKVLSVVLAVSVVAASLATMGCDLYVGGRSRGDVVYVRPQVQVVEEQPQYVMVQQAPPAMIVESQPMAPSVNHVWVAGYWNWDNQRYSWQAGRYMVPPQTDVIWVAPRYETDAHGTRYTAGQWKKQAPGKDHINR